MKELDYITRTGIHITPIEEVVNSLSEDGVLEVYSGKEAYCYFVQDIKPKYKKGLHVLPKNKIHALGKSSFEDLMEEKNIIGVFNGGRDNDVLPGIFGYLVSKRFYKKAAS